MESNKGSKTEHVIHHLSLTLGVVLAIVVAVLGSGTEKFFWWWNEVLHHMVVVVISVGYEAMSTTQARGLSRFGLFDSISDSLYLCFQIILFPCEPNLAGLHFPLQFNHFVL